MLHIVLSANLLNSDWSMPKKTYWTDTNETPEIPGGDPDRTKCDFFGRHIPSWESPGGSYALIQDLSNAI